MFECFYAFWNGGPFQFNYMLFFVKAVGTFVLLMTSHVDAVRTALDQPLLLQGTKTVGKLELFKLKYSLILPFIITVLPYVMVDVPFIFTHKIPAVMVFLPILLLWATLTILTFTITSPKLVKAVWSMDDDTFFKQIQKTLAVAPLDLVHGPEE